MGGLLLFREDESVASLPQHLKWLKILEDERSPPLSSLANMCAHYVAQHLHPIVLHRQEVTLGVEEVRSAKHLSRAEKNKRIGDTFGKWILGETLSKEEEEEFMMVVDVNPDPDIVYDSSSDLEDDGSQTCHRTILEPRPGVCLPTEVAQKIWDFAAQKTDNDSYTAIIFGCPRAPLPLYRLRFSNQSNGLRNPLLIKYLKAHGKTLRELDISGSTGLGPVVLGAINQYCHNLKELNLGKCTHLFQDLENSQLFGPTLNILHGPAALEKLTVNAIRGMDVEEYDEFYLRLVGRYEHTLTYLDLSGCEVGNFRFLAHLSVLRVLILYNVELGEGTTDGFFSVLPLLAKSIRHLDLSQPGSKLESWGNYRNPNLLLDAVARALPELLSLDISGTNLAGSGVAQRVPGDEPLRCDIPGLNARAWRPLEYLGLYGTAHDASHRHCIPAKIIGGCKDEMQIINAARIFIDRLEVLEKMLNDLFHIFRMEEGRHISECLRLILLAMERHPGEKHIQISGSASLFYIVKNNQNLSPVSTNKKRILSAIVNAMAIHVSDATMMRNGCLTICHFKIPHDVMFVYEKLVFILLRTLGNAGSNTGGNDDFNERIAIYLLNSLACQVEGEHKQLVGDLGAIQKMLSLIQIRLNRHECDDVMEIAWSTMWNVTDETPENCALFLQHNGMSLFLQCLQAFPEQPELLRNMMGLLGNVAEVEKLRSHLMTPEFITVFYKLLNSKQDNIEVSYNAAGVLAHILSDGEEAWVGVDSPTREQVCQRMSQNIQEWDLHSPRNINYRSFRPILRLLKIGHTMQCRLWAAWALANLTTVYPEKYVKLLEEEDGINHLRPLLGPPEPPELVEYARTAYNNVCTRSRNQMMMNASSASSSSLSLPLLG